MIREAGKEQAEEVVAPRLLGTVCMVALLGAGCAETSPQAQTPSPSTSAEPQSEEGSVRYPFHRPRPYLIPPGGGKRRWSDPR